MKLSAKTTGGKSRPLVKTTNGKTRFVRDCCCSPSQCSCAASRGPFSVDYFPCVNNLITRTLLAQRPRIMTWTYNWNISLSSSTTFINPNDHRSDYSNNATILYSGTASWCYINTVGGSSYRELLNSASSLWNIQVVQSGWGAYTVSDSGTARGLTALQIPASLAGYVFGGPVAAFDGFGRLLADNVIGFTNGLPNAVTYGGYPRTGFLCQFTGQANDSGQRSGNTGTYTIDYQDSPLSGRFDSQSIYAPSSYATTRITNETRRSSATWTRTFDFCGFNPSSFDQPL